MQDRTINNALLLLRKLGGTQGRLAEVLSEIRQVQWTGWCQNTPIRRGLVKNFVIAELQGVESNTLALPTALAKIHPDLTPISARNRVYQALRRLEDRSLVERLVVDGKLLWRLSNSGEPTNPTNPPNKV